MKRRDFLKACGGLMVSLIIPVRRKFPNAQEMLLSHDSIRIDGGAGLWRSWVLYPITYEPKPTGLIECHA